MKEVTIDYETRGVTDLGDHGAFVYAEDPLPEPQCLCLAEGADEPLIWAPPRVRKIINPDNIQCELIGQDDVIDILTSADKIVAQNSMFEFLITNWVCTRLYGWPEIPLEKFHDTMAQLAYHALPMNLEQAAKVLGLTVQKNMIGNRVMKKLCKPRTALKKERLELEAEGWHLNDDGSWSRDDQAAPMWLWHEGTAPLKYTKKDVETILQERGWCLNKDKSWSRANDVAARSYAKREVEETEVRAITPPPWNEMETVLNYCREDVDATRLIHHSIAKLPPKEREIWLHNETVNLRGVLVDHRSVNTIIDTVETEEAKQLVRFQGVTKSAVSGPRSYVKLKEWVNERTGMNLKSVDKEKTEVLLESDDLPDDVREALVIKSQLSKSSVAKFRAMKNRAAKNGRVNGWAMYHGASTGRWSARGLQLHNNPRDSYDPEDYDYVIDLMESGQIDLMGVLYDTPYFVGSRCVRGSLIAPPGHEFICSDFSAIEGRGNAYLAGDKAALVGYAEGLESYKVDAMGIFNVAYDEVTKDQRQVGKVSNLALGYGGGIGAYVSMAHTYRVDLEELPGFVLPGSGVEEREKALKMAKRYLKRTKAKMSVEAAMACDVIKQRWRAAHPAIESFWYGLEHAAKEAIQNPGRIFSYSGVRFGVDGMFLKCLIPSGRVLHYFRPEISKELERHDDAPHEEPCLCKECARPSVTIKYWGMKVVDGKTTRQWVKLHTYGGKLVENCVQAFCRDLLAEAMLRLEKAGYPIVLHVHDEAVAEMLIGKGSLEEFNRIMEIVPPWATGMPIKAEGWVGKRYRK